MGNSQELEVRPRAIPIAEALPRPRTLEEAAVLPGKRARLLGRSSPGRTTGWEAFGARRRKLVTGTVAAVTLLAAGLIGALFGSGLYSVDGRFAAERLAAQTGRAELRSLPNVPGHPGAREGFDRMDVVRQIMALDGVQ